MSELFTDIAIVVMYLGTALALCAFVGIVLRVGDLGFWCFGKLDEYLQDRHFAKLRKSWEKNCTLKDCSTPQRSSYVNSYNQLCSTPDC